jgi:phage terminase large subunit
MYYQACKGNPKAWASLMEYGGNRLQPQENTPDDTDPGGKHSYLECPQVLMGPAFYQLYEQVARHDYTYYTLKGGRGSLKSSFISLAIVKGITTNKDYSAIVFRRWTNDLRDTVFAQISWAIDALGVSDDFEEKLSPMKFIYKPTGQEIQFRGLDKPLKTKSIKPRAGYFAYIWFEELDQFSGPDAIGVVLKSVMRGGNNFWVFKSFNPPESINNWVNYEASNPREDEVIHSSDYRTAPPSWIGEQFIKEAERSRIANPDEYNHDYLGIAIGTGGEVFKNVLIRDITDDEIKEFDHVRRGVDWGQVVDPMAYVVCHFDRARRTIYIFHEYYKSGASLRQLATAIKAENNLNEQVRCDSAEKRSTKELRDEHDINAVNARKGPGSVERGIRFLAKDIDKIVIDKKRCPNAAREFTCYELEKDKDGNFKADYPDCNNHTIDALRYAMEPDMDSYKGVKAGKVNLGG